MYPQQYNNKDKIRPHQHPDILYMVLDIVPNTLRARSLRPIPTLLEGIIEQSLLLLHLQSDYLKPLFAHPLYKLTQGSNSPNKPTQGPKIYRQYPTQQPSGRGSEEGEKNGG
ncbi:5952_t:CDS:1 [Paraglomus brasilianum]|uniref:5952_t:CDS:1 n=1 Tax=Paraglomus brasilianum TaxID=144538 RepID=A0A9N8VTA1_9GLOM|nr:5952_t:CDS:1 [Paraglomus brasilianum]